jgi:hypothetical protein
MKYGGGSLQTVKPGEYLKVFIDPASLRLVYKKRPPIVLRADSIMEISYGEDVRRRLEEAAALAFFTLGIGALMAFSKAKKHYIGVLWDDGDSKGGIVLQARKDDYRGILVALESLTGKKAVDTDPKPVAAKPAKQATTVPQ